MDVRLSIPKMRLSVIHVTSLLSSSSTPAAQLVELIRKTAMSLHRGHPEPVKAKLEDFSWVADGCFLFLLGGAVEIINRYLYIYNYDS